MEKRITQSDKNIPDGITCEHILKAVKDYEEDIIEHSFIDSRDYDVIINDEKYPPKAIIGLASRYLIDRPLAPSEFSAGLDKKCFKVLKELGFDVIPKSLISTPFDPKINPETILSNQELFNLFKCANAGGMRRSKATNTLVLIMDHTKAMYEDLWHEDILYYTGMGLTGDQVLTGNQNKTLTESNFNGVHVHLFEVFKSNEYTYRGEVTLIEKPFQKTQPDQNNDLRNVYIFPLKLKDSKLVVIESSVLNTIKIKKEKQLHKLQDSELEKKLIYAQNKEPGFRYTKTKAYQRSDVVVEVINRRAKGICELCAQQAPFIKKNGQPYLEVHHIIRLADGGADTVENAVALCPNCHRRMHSLNFKEDILKLMY